MQLSCITQLEDYTCFAPTTYWKVRDTSKRSEQWLATVNNSEQHSHYTLSCLLCGSIHVEWAILPVELQLASEVPTIHADLISHDYCRVDLAPHYKHL
jgi:hypothetical protein